jgi:hypothetical protein
LSNTLAGSACHVARGGGPEAGAAAGGARPARAAARRADQIARHAEELGEVEARGGSGPGDVLIDRPIGLL